MISLNDLVVTKGIYIKKFTQEPYTGLVETYYQSGRLKENGEMINGKKVNKWINYADTEQHDISKEENYSKNNYELTDYYAEDSTIHRHLIKREDNIFFVRLFESKMVMNYWMFNNTRSSLFTSEGEVPPLFCILSFKKGKVASYGTYYLNKSLDTNKVLEQFKIGILGIGLYDYIPYGELNNSNGEKDIEIDNKNFDAITMKSFSEDCKYKRDQYAALNISEKEKLHDNFYEKKMSLRNLKKQEGFKEKIYRIFTILFINANIKYNNNMLPSEFFDFSPGDSI